MVNNMNLKQVLMTSLILSGAVSSAILEVHDAENFIYTDDTAPKLHSSIINRSNIEQDVKLIKKRVLMPEGWDVTFCFKQCLPAFIDETVVTMAPGDSISLDVDYLIDPEQTASGSAVTEMTFYPENDPSESYVRSYGVTFGENKEHAPLSFSVETPSQVALLHSLLEHKVAVHNSSDEDKEVTITRIEHNVPADWNVTMCFDLCMPPFLKSGDWTIPAMSSKEMQLDIEPASEGNAVIQLDIGEKGEDPMSSIMLSYPTEGATAIAGSEGAALKKPFRLTGTASHYSLAFPTGGSTRIVLFNMKGQKLSVLYNGHVTSKQSISLDLSSFGTSALILQIKQNESTHAFPIHALN